MDEREGSLLSYYIESVINLLVSWVLKVVAPECTRHSGRSYICIGVAVDIGGSGGIHNIIT